MKKIVIFLILIVGTGTKATTHDAPSFDCKKAHSKSEMEICSKSQLSILDRNLNASFQAYKKLLSKDELSQAKTSQLLWLKERGKCENLSENKKFLKCLNDTMEDRILEIQKLFTEKSIAIGDSNEALKLVKEFTGTYQDILTEIYFSPFKTDSKALNFKFSSVAYTLDYESHLGCDISGVAVFTKDHEFVFIPPNSQNRCRLTIKKIGDKFIFDDNRSCKNEYCPELRDLDKQEFCINKNKIVDCNQQKATTKSNPVELSNWVGKWRLKNTNSETKGTLNISKCQENNCKFEISTYDGSHQCEMSASFDAKGNIGKFIDNAQNENPDAPEGPPCDLSFKMASDNKSITVIENVICDSYCGKGGSFNGKFLK